MAKAKGFRLVKCMMKTKFDKIIKEISENHHEILDDWCKAYVAHLYIKGKEINPGCFTLIEQQMHEHNGKLVKKYWFEEKE